MNSGFACIVIKKIALAKILQDNNIFKLKEMKKFRMGSKDLKTFAPGAESDIIWNSFLHPNKYAGFKRWGFWILLNLIFIYLLTPTKFNNFIDSKKDIPGSHHLDASWDGFLTFL